MKKIILFFFAASFISLTNAQSFRILDTLKNDITSATLNVYGDVSALASIKAYVLNTSTGKSVKVKRIENSLVSGSENYFCWTQCYAPMVNVSPTSEYIAAADTNKKFIADLDSKGYTGTSTITYVFFDVANTSDTAFITVNYNIYPTGLNHLDGINQVSAYPNPANSDLKLSYKVNNTEGSKIIIYNMLGSVVKSLDINALEGKVNLSVSDLKAGIYFYSLITEGKATVTKRFTVTR